MTKRDVILRLRDGKTAVFPCKFSRERAEGILSARMPSLLARTTYGQITLSKLVDRMEFHGWRCRYCGCDFQLKVIRCFGSGPGRPRQYLDFYGIELRVDHVIPVARGGSNWPANLVPACNSCNSKKHAKLVEEFRN